MTPFDKFYEENKEVLTQMTFHDALKTTFEAGEEEEYERFSNELKGYEGLFGP